MSPRQLALPLLLALALTPVARADDVPKPADVAAAKPADAAASKPAAAADAPKAPDGLWHGSVALGGALATSNSATGTVNANVNAARETVVGKWSLWGIGNYSAYYSRGVDTTTANTLRLGSRYDKYFNEQLFIFGAIEAETNRPAGLSHRVSTDVGTGYKLLRSETSSFDLFAGVGDTANRYTSGVLAEGVQMLFGEESSHKLTPTTSLRQRLSVRTGDGNVGSLTTFDANLATKLVGDWTLTTAFQARRSGRPPVGAKSTTSLLTIGIGYKF
ncbi:MAG: DUF481 domain-containing protein [Paucibacter sp.]|nr:DUF481 domain-containing protein [Roseateles sp.]